MAMRESDPVELIQIGLPILIEVVAVVLFIAAAAVWTIIASQPVPV